MVFTAAFLVVGLLPLLADSAPRYWAFAIAAAFLVVAMVVPRLLAPLNRAWTKFGLILSKITTPIVLGILFFGVVTPIALMMRATGKDPLSRQFEQRNKTYWIERNPPGPSPETMKNMF